MQGIKSREDDINNVSFIIYLLLYIDMKLNHIKY